MLPGNFLIFRTAELLILEVIGKCFFLINEKRTTFVSVVILECFLSFAVIEFSICI